MGEFTLETEPSMHFLRLLACLALSAGVAAPSFAQPGDESFFFRYTNTGVLAVGDGQQEPETPEEPEDDPLRVEFSFPSALAAGTEYEFRIQADGGTGTYGFSAEGHPAFVHLDADGTVHAFPEAEDAGNYDGMTFTVSDGEATASTGPFSFSVTVGGTFPMPVAAYHNGVETERAPLYDGKSGAGSWVRLTGPASYVEYAYDSPITATGAYLHVSGGTTVEAFVAGQWVQVAQTSGPFKGDVHAVEGLSFTSDRWRVKRRSASGATSAVHEFRPGPSPMHLGPVFTTRPGFVATRGTTVAFAATGGTGYYTDAPLSYSFHEAGEIPDGLSLTDEGTLSVDPDADVATTWYFQVKVEDGVGFHDVRGFYVTHDAPAAADLMAHDFSLDGSGVDYRSMYDGAALDAPSPVSVNQSRALVVDFGHVVRADRVVAGFAAMPTGARARIDHEIDGAWVQGPVIQPSQSGSAVEFPEVSALRFRILANNAYTFNVTEFRVGAGPVHV